MLTRNPQCKLYVNIFSLAAFNGGLLAEMNNAVPPPLHPMQFIYPNTPTSDMDKLRW